MFSLINTIQKKIFFFSLLLIIIVSAVSLLLVYSEASEIINNNAISYINSNMKSIDTYFSSAFEEMEKIAIKVAINEQILATLSNPYPIASYEEFNQNKVIKAILSSAIGNKSYISEIVLVAKDKKVFTSSSAFRSYQEMETIIQNKNGYVLSPDNKLGYVWHIIKNQAEIGTVLILMNSDEAKNTLDSFTIPQFSLFLLTQDYYPIASNNSDYSNFNTKTFLENLTISESFIKTSSGNKYFVTKNYFEGANLTLCGITPYSNVINNSLKVLQTIIIVSLCAIPLVIFISWLLSSMIMKNFKKLRLSMLKVSQGDLSVRAPITKDEEIKDMAIVFNNMMEKIELLIEEKTQKELQKQAIEQNYLQAQIRPHFIYNTINTMKYIAHRNGETDIENASVALVELLRASIGKKGEFVTIEEEINYIKQFVTLQEFKTEKKINITFDVETEVKEYPIPILSLEPIVENAIIHGLKDKADGTIVINIYHIKDKLYLIVKDNGTGMERLIEKDSDLKLSGVGINNVFDRLNFLYGNSSTAKISSTPNLGTRVEIIIPYV